MAAANIQLNTAFLIPSIKSVKPLKYLQVKMQRMKEATAPEMTKPNTQNVLPAEKLSYQLPNTELVLLVDCDFLVIYFPTDYCSIKD